MLSGRGPQDLSSCVVDQLSEGRPVGLHILAVQRGGFQTYFQDDRKTLFGVGVLQLGVDKPFWSLLALLASFRLDSDVELGDDEAVVCPAINAAHRLRHPHIDFVTRTSAHPACTRYYNRKGLMNNNKC